MSDSEFQRIIGRAIIKRGFDALTHGASPLPTFRGPSNLSPFSPHSQRNVHKRPRTW